MTRWSRWIVLSSVLLWLVGAADSRANPWNGKVVLQAFWWDSWNDNYPQDWYTYLAKLAPRLRALGFDGIWIPAPSKGLSGANSNGYDPFDHYDLGDKDQMGTVATRFGDKDSLLRLIAVAHANGLEVYPDIVLNHTIGGGLDPTAPGSDKFKRFRYPSVGGEESGRWPKDHWNFHPNPDHACLSGDWCEQLFGPDNCFLDAEHGGGGNGRYMRDQARAWFVWLARQTGVDGFRFDAVKHYPAYVVEDLLFNAMGERLDYFAVGEFVGNREQLDSWVAHTRRRAGTFDFSLRGALASIVEAGGLFDMGSLPGYQQQERLKTVPFINNHDTWRGAHWDSKQGSQEHDDREGDWRQNPDELAPTIDPDNPRAPVAHAAAFAVDGSPLVYYEDLFVNHGPRRFSADPASIVTRDYVVNLVWAHQKLDFKDGAYKVRFQSSPDLLVIERAGRALVGLNDHGNESLSAWVQTDFGPGVPLHDYSGATSAELETDANGWVHLTVPPTSYAIWAPPGAGGGFAPPARRTVQQFELADDLGDSRPGSLGYGGRVVAEAQRFAGSVWVAAGSQVEVWVRTEGERQVEVTIYGPAADGSKSRTAGEFTRAGPASSEAGLHIEFTARDEGYHQLAVQLAATSEPPTRATVTVDYRAPATSDKF